LFIHFFVARFFSKEITLKEITLYRRRV